VLLTAPHARQDSHGEVLRLIDTFQLAAEECTRMYGAGPPGLLPRSGAQQGCPALQPKRRYTCYHCG
jgi:hypothetical protein